MLIACGQAGSRCLLSYSMIAWPAIRAGQRRRLLLAAHMARRRSYTWSSSDTISDIGHASSVSRPFEARSRPHDLTIETDGGRRLGVRLAGAPDGPLVVYMHGSPSSRLDVDYMHERSERRGIQLVGIDRPGYGLSEPMAFTFTSVARDVGAVADALGSPEFAVFGQSSGVGYSLATAAELRNRVSAVATAGGGMPFRPGTGQWEQLSEGEKQGVLLAGTDDAEAERLLAEADLPTVEQLRLRDDEIASAWMAILSPADQRVLAAGFGRLIGPTLRECLRQGQVGWARDNLVRMPRWDFDLGAIECPATIWVGEQDKGNVEGANWLSHQVPGAVLRDLPDQGHFVAFELWDEVLDSLSV
jgi:pimeloyl-ACP methyl ester carboxylesterase